MSKQKRLTEMTRSSGWAAKIGPDVLAQVLCELPKNIKDENLLVGIETSDDAAVYKINDDTAVVLTVDFFTPIVDDPYLYGQIAAANSLSDVYAMGTDPLLAMNIVCFPEGLCTTTIEGILRGGHDKVREAGAMVVGGHTIEDKEPKFGLSVTGFIHPDDVMTNANAKVGDILVLTKAIGVGVINTAFKAGVAEDKSYEEAILSMRTLNKFAKDAMMKVGANSCTDVTGFGLMGHAFEMAEGSNVSIKMHTDKIPFIFGALELAAMGIIPAGAYANMKHIEDEVFVDEKVEQNVIDCMYDPQTSGGLLISVPKEKEADILKALEDNVTPYAVIGEVVEKEKHYILVD